MQEATKANVTLPLITGVGGLIVGATAVIVPLFVRRRRPRIRAGEFAEETDDGYYEGYVVEAVVGQRPLEVEEIGLLILYGPRFRRRKLHVRGRPSKKLPALLTDGEKVETSFELDGLIEDLWDRIGNEERLKSR